LSHLETLYHIPDMQSHDQGAKSVLSQVAETTPSTKKELNITTTWYVLTTKCSIMFGYVF